MRSLRSIAGVTCAVLASGEVCPAGNPGGPAAHPLHRAPVVGAAVDLGAVAVGAKVARTSDWRMVSANMDFWHGTHPRWGYCGVLDADFQNAYLPDLLQQLGGGLWRIGGSPADFVLYDMREPGDTSPSMCSAANVNKTHKVPGQSYFCPNWDQAGGSYCLTLARWKEMNEFATKAGMKMALDLNACWDRANAASHPADGLKMVASLVNATAKGAAEGWAAVWAFEYGNELYSSGVHGDVYGGDMVALKKVVDVAWDTYAPGKAKPVLVGPDNGAGYMSANYAAQILNVSQGAMTALTYHEYSGEKCGVPEGMVYNLSCFEATHQSAVDLYLKAADAAGAELWLGEGAQHGSSGVLGVTNTFTSTFYYMSTLGWLARNRVTNMCRQTIIGGEYELINKTTTQPNPDFYALVMWSQLMGADVYDAALPGCTSEACRASVRVYAHARHGAPAGAGAPNVTLLVINFSTETDYTVAAAPGGTAYVRQLTGDTASDAVYLNGALLRYGGVGKFPDLQAAAVPAGKVAVPKASVTFITFD
eukprot:TRINITY_DN2885_c2_g1_i1.p1 TRINITY_DN2885_c2_g1~~TRINITY_DN2885_c2_g1_i1.p1  ORF type:complete len:535 (+),score=153.73 TRINITY_DN2885_c2_g1_i1:44-1648(+)